MCPCALLLFALGTGQSARADEAADTAAARILGNDGLDLAEAGNCSQAIEKLRRAEELHHAPTTAGRLGECEIAVGKVVAGTERLQRLLREPVSPAAPAPFVEALGRARAALEKALPRIATMRVDVKAPAGAKVQVTLDGEPLPEAILGNDRPTDPGRHTLEATLPGGAPATRQINLADGETARVTLELTAAAAPPEPPTRGARSERSVPVPLTPQPHASSGANAPAIVFLTLGGLGVVAGATGGIIVAMDSSDLSKSCGAARRCPTDKASELSSAKTWSTVSTVGFAVAGAGLATGLILLATGGHESREGRPSSEARLTPLIGPLFVGCEGAF